MKLASIMGMVAVFLAIFVYGQVLSVRGAVLIFLLFAACLVWLVFIWPNLHPRK